MKRYCLRVALLIIAILFIVMPLVSCCDSDCDECKDKKEVAILSIEVTPANQWITENSTQQYTATVTLPDNSTQVFTQKVKWYSSDTEVATINSSGLATSKTSGTTTIEAVYGNMSGTASLAVGTASPETIVITPANPCMPEGKELQFTATHTLLEEDVTEEVTWSSSNTAVAKISSDGVAESIASGTTEIQATYEDISDTTLLTVTTICEKYDAEQGRIIVNNDEWTLSDGIPDTDYEPFAGPNNAGTFAKNIASWFTGCVPGKFLVYSENHGLTGSNLADAMTSEGHTWTVDSSVTFNLSTLMQYDAVFLGDIPADNAVLINYVNAGGSVYVMGGTTLENPKTASTFWNTFLKHFGLQYSTQHNTFRGDIPISSTHPILCGLGDLLMITGNSITDLEPSNAKNQVIAKYQGQGLIAIYDPAQ